MNTLRTVNYPTFRLFVTAFVALIFAIPLAVHGQRNGQLPTVMELYESHLKFNGGRNNMSLIQSLLITGQLKTSDGEVKNYKLIKKRPSMIRFQVEHPKGEITIYYNGEDGYRKYESISGETRLQELSEEDMVSYRQESDIEGPFFHLSGQADLVESIEEAVVSGQDAFKLQLVDDANLRYDTIWISQEHFQELKLSRHVEKDGEPIYQEVFFSDFDTIDGVYYARNSQFFEDGELKSVIRVDQVRSNAGIFDSTFRP